MFVIFRGPIRVDICEVFLVCSIAVTLSTVACLLVDSLLGLSFGKEAYITI